MWKTLTEGHIEIFVVIFRRAFELVISSPLNMALSLRYCMKCRQFQCNETSDHISLEDDDVYKLT